MSKSVAPRRASETRTALAVRDPVLETLTEFADQVRSITRAGGLGVVVDADHGYGNALNVIRTVQELEHAGVSALAIEDVAMPARFGANALENAESTAARRRGEARAAKLD